MTRARAADARLHRAASAQLAHSGTGTGADIALANRCIGGRLRRLVAAVGGRSDLGVAAEPRSNRMADGTNRHDATGAHSPADAALLEKAHRALGRVEAVRAAA
jgi:hypothetical protein